MTKSQKDILHFGGAIFIFLIILSLIYMLSQRVVPQVNKDLISIAIGTLSATLVQIISVIVGTKPDEVINLQKKIDSLQSSNHQLVKAKDNLEGMLINLQKEIISSGSIVFASMYDSITKNKIKDSIKRECVCGDHTCSCRGINNDKI
tara:strand:+ start:645 stop:1088 length:444 start_codon:yes stop_codon:yes gene_type:complete